MSPLRGLRTNCILAPLSVAVLAAGALLLAWRWHAADLAAADGAARQGEVAGLARLVESGAAPGAAAWLAAHPGCVAVGRWRLAGDRLVALDAAGAARSDEPTPELVLAFNSARTWREDGLVAAAAPGLPAAGPAQLVVGWWLPAAGPAPEPWLALAGAVLLAGGGLGWYLAARVYRPVRWLERAAQAAAAGAPEPAGRVDSAETESLRSSIATILGRESDGHG